MAYQLPSPNLQIHRNWYNIPCRLMRHARVGSYPLIQCYYTSYCNPGKTYQAKISAQTYNCPTNPPRRSGQSYKHDRDKNLHLSHYMKTTHWWVECIYIFIKTLDITPPFTTNDRKNIVIEKQTVGNHYRMERWRDGERWRVVDWENGPLVGPVGPWVGRYGGMEEVVALKYFSDCYFLNILSLYPLIIYIFH